MNRAKVIAVAAMAVLAAGACTSESAGSAPPSSAPGTRSGSSTPTASSAVGLKVEEVTGGLEHGWDVGFLPDGKVLLTQRPGKLTLLSGGQPGATASDVAADFSDVLVRGEGGLLGLLVHPGFATSRQFTTCQTHTENGTAKDIRLVTWRLADDDKSAAKVKDLLTGLPVNPSGRHSGCRPALAQDGSLIVGTGDTAKATVSQDRTALGGKVLRLDLATGTPAAGNPFLTDPNEHTRLIYTYGHRNVQGITPRPGTDQIFTAEHGPTENDEVNRIVAGKNYGWDPSRGGTVGGYDEGVPMTDLTRFPDAMPAVWESGSTTEAICGAAFLSGQQWGDLDGALVITALKGAKLLILKLDQAGAVTTVTIPPEIADKYGRLRAARTGPDGALYVTTSNGSDDKLLRITPA